MCFYGEGEANPANMLPSTFSNQFIVREGQAPAEPMRRQLGRSLALPHEDSADRFKSAVRLITSW